MVQGYAAIMNNWCPTAGHGRGREGLREGHGIQGSESLSYPTNSTLLCQKVLKGQTIGKNHTSQGNSSGPKFIKASNRIQPTTSFYLPVDGACLLTRYLRSSTGSQMFCSLVLGFLEVKSLVWTSIPVLFQFHSSGDGLNYYRGLPF